MRTIYCGLELARCSKELPRDANNLHRTELGRQVLLKAGAEAQCCVPLHYVQYCKLLGVGPLGAMLELLPAGTQQFKWHGEATKQKL